MTPANTCPMDLHTLFEGLSPTALTGEVVDLTLDSRTAVPDGLFIACAGTRQHGLDFLPDALRRGVGAVAWESGPSLEAPALPVGVRGVPVFGLRDQLGEVANRFFNRPSAALQVTGITGTNGKTTTAWLVMQALTRLGSPAGYLGTLGHGLPGALSPALLTTPDCISFHRQLRALADGGATHAVVEVSSHALDQSRVAGVRFATVAFTNLTRDHLDYHQSLSAYGAAKARLFAGGAPRAVLNLDDEFGRELAQQLPEETALLGVRLRGANQAKEFATQQRGALLEGTVQAAPKGLSLELHLAGQVARVESPLWGQFNGENLLLAAGILLGYTESLTAVAQALSECVAPPGRMQRLPANGGQPAVLVDFAHTPDALCKALAAMREHCSGQVWCVFGCGGDRDRGKRAAMGVAALAGADWVILTNDNPRGENPASIIEDILACGKSPRLQVILDRAAAIEQAISEAGAGDAVLIAGKGHETLQIIGTDAQPFSDARVASKILLMPRSPSDQMGSP